MSKIKSIISSQLRDNHGDEHISRTILIAIAFVAGGILLAAVFYAVVKYYPGGIGDRISDILH